MRQNHGRLLLVSLVLRPRLLLAGVLHVGDDLCRRLGHVRRARRLRGGRALPGAGAAVAHLEVGLPTPTIVNINPDRTFTFETKSAWRRA